MSPPWPVLWRVGVWFACVCVHMRAHVCAHTHAQMNGQIDTLCLHCRDWRKWDEWSLPTCGLCDLAVSLILERSVSYDERHPEK